MCSLYTLDKEMIHVPPRATQDEIPSQFSELQATENFRIYFANYIYKFDHEKLTLYKVWLHGDFCRDESLQSI